MLNSRHMNVSQPGGEKPEGAALRIAFRSFLSVRNRTCFGALIAASLCLPAYAQPSSQDMPGQNGNSDCSDPLLASSSSCSGQNTDRQGPFGSQQLSMPQSGTASTQPSVPGMYSDTENLSRQLNGRNQTGAPALPPEPLTEFQKFIAATTGQILPIYGESLFRRVPSTFAPLDMTPVPSNYIIGPGDELRLRVWGQVSFQANVRVDRSGDVFLPHVGPVHVAGESFSGLDVHLRAAIARVFRNFDLTVDMGQIRALQVYVAGQARHPGVYTVSSLSTLVDTLFASGGPSVQGSLRHIQLRRAGAQVTELDLYDLLTKGDKSKDVQLAPGDIIFIPPVGPQVALTGSVRNSAIYELKSNESLSDLLADAGGVSAVAAEARVSIERIDDHRDRHSMEVAYDPSGLSTPLADGDLVRVYSIVPSYRKTVMLRGNIANPGRFAWHPGMRVSELIPDKESLITRNYWWKRTQLGLPSPEFEPAVGLTNLRQPTEATSLTAQLQQQYQFQMRQYPFSSQQTPYGTPQNQAGAQAYPNGTQGAQLDQYGNQLFPFGIAQNQYGVQPYPYGAPQDQSAAQQDRTMQGTASEGQTRGTSSSLGAQQSNRTARIAGAAERTEVRILAPEIDWNYAVIERLDSNTLKTTLVPFDLGKLVLQHDASQDLELQAGDVVSIFSEADIRLPLAQQTKLVKLEGEFVHAGSYSVQPGETLHQLIERAGGFTPNAYLYGSEFTRESTRTIQQARIDEYVRTLETEMQRGTLATAASASASAQDVAASTAAQGSERELIARLRQIRATGRIVLEFKGDSAGTGLIPEIPLEDGDSFVVPPVPASINVIGAVYDQNSFLYNKSRSVGTYLHMAGGPNRSADRKHAFIIRADGEVVSRETSSGPWSGGFNKLRLNPGDSIVVPDKVLRPSAIKGILEWSQLFSQFALGAAALSVIQ